MIGQASIAFESTINSAGALSDGTAMPSRSPQDRKQMSEPLLFEPGRFCTAAAHYRAGRRPYPPVLIRRVAEATALNEQHRVLDLGCGPGNLAIGFGYFAGEVVGLDPAPEMVAAAVAAAQGLTPNVSFRQGSSYELGLELGCFRLVTMGRSFHWMDRAQTLRSLDQIVQTGGALALFGEAHPDSPENGWLKEWEEITDRYAATDPLQERRQAGTWATDETVLLASPFPHMEKIILTIRDVVCTESLIERALSHRIDKQPDRLVQDLREVLERIAPDGSVTETVEWVALIARRIPSQVSSCT
jgi:ubiquinone/menaquinone biosynthesis C-methylase UbiE